MSHSPADEVFMIHDHEVADTHVNGDGDENEELLDSMVPSRLFYAMDEAIRYEMIDLPDLPSTNHVVRSLSYDTWLRLLQAVETGAASVVAIEAHGRRVLQRRFQRGIQRMLGIPFSMIHADLWESRLPPSDDYQMHNSEMLQRERIGRDYQEFFKKAMDAVRTSQLFRNIRPLSNFLQRYNRSSDEQRGMMFARPPVRPATCNAILRSALSSAISGHQQGPTGSSSYSAVVKPTNSRAVVSGRDDLSGSETPTSCAVEDSADGSRGPHPPKAPLGGTRPPTIRHTVTPFR
jgi:hypothetical protein